MNKSKTEMIMVIYVLYVFTTYTFRDYFKEFINGKGKAIFLGN